MDGLAGLRERLLLCCYEIGCRGEFMKLWAVRSPSLETKHRMYKLPLDMEFWGRLVGSDDAGWLLSGVRKSDFILGTFIAF